MVVPVCVFVIARSAFSTVVFANSVPFAASSWVSLNAETVLVAVPGDAGAVALMVTVATVVSRRLVNVQVVTLPAGTEQAPPTPPEGTAPVIAPPPVSVSVKARVSASTPELFVTVTVYEYTPFGSTFGAEPLTLKSI